MVFQCINICQVPREVLKTAAFGLGFQYLPWDLANANAWKTMFDPYISKHPDHPRSLSGIRRHQESLPCDIRHWFLEQIFLYTLNTHDRFFCLAIISSVCWSFPLILNTVLPLIPNEVEIRHFESCYHSSSHDDDSLATELYAVIYM